MDLLLGFLWNLGLAFVWPYQLYHNIRYKVISPLAERISLTMGFLLCVLVIIAGVYHTSLDPTLLSLLVAAWIVFGCYVLWGHDDED